MNTAFLIIGIIIIVLQILQYRTTYTVTANQAKMYKIIKLIFEKMK